MDTVEPSKVVIVSSSESTSSSRVTLEEILENKLPAPLDLQSFRRYCRKAQCEENLDFLVDLDRVLAEPDLGVAKQLYRFLYAKYIFEDAEAHVNLSSRDFEQLGLLIAQLESAEAHDLTQALVAARRSIVLLLRNDTLNHYLMRLVLDRQLSLAQDLALWWRKPISVAAFFTFPDPVNTLDSRLHAAVNMILIAVHCALLWTFNSPWLGIPVVYGFLARVLAGPRIDPQAFLVLFVLRPLVEDVLGLANSSFSAGAPRRAAQCVGLCFSGTALALGFVGMRTASLGVWAVLLLFTTLQVLFNVCMVCVMYHCAEYFGFKGPDSEIKYVSKKESSRSRSRHNSDAGITSPKPPRSPKSTTMQSATFAMSDSRSKFNATLP